MNHNKNIEDLLQRIYSNVDSTDCVVVKSDLKDLIKAMVLLFVESTPELINPNIPDSKKGTLFFSAIIKLGSEGARAMMLEKFSPGSSSSFKTKIAGLTNLEAALNRYTR